MAFVPRWLTGPPADHPVGKIVCVGRNYAAHAAELGNSVPIRPVIFFKPGCAATDLHDGVWIPTHLGEVHHELEIAVLLASDLIRSPMDPLAAVGGVGLALDLTLRDIQNDLKQQGHPWERAKGFGKSCPVSRFVEFERESWGTLGLELTVNDQLRQQGSTSLMLFSLAEILADVASWCDLSEGDILLTGTPAGVAPLVPGDRLTARLVGTELVAETTVDAWPDEI